MNLQFRENFGQNYPDTADGYLDCISMSLTCSFNRKGTLLAVGCNDGRIVIWDFLTRGMAKIINAHTHPVSHVIWSRNGYKLLSVSTDRTVGLWDVLSGERELCFRFPAFITQAQLNPDSPDGDKLLVSLLSHPAVLMSKDGRHKDVPLDKDGDINVVSCFDRKGLHIFTGNSKGRVSVYTTEELKLVSSFRISNSSTANSSIRAIAFSRNGSSFLINSTDKIIRVYKTDDALKCEVDRLEPEQKLQDLVNKNMWKKCCFSGDTEYVCAGATRQHCLYIWEKATGNLVKILQGTKGETLLDLDWHPRRADIVSTASGVVSIWAQRVTENWSAFAPDFKELDENVEYEERESEFDIEDEDKDNELLNEDNDSDEEVDVLTVAPSENVLSSGDDTMDCLMYLPVAPEIDNPEESAGKPLVATPNTPNPSTADEQLDKEIIDVGLENYVVPVNTKVKASKSTDKLAATAPKRKKKPAGSKGKKRAKKSASKQEVVKENGVETNNETKNS